MTRIKNKEEILKMVNKALDDYSFVGVRGLPKRDASKKYRKNQYLTKSYYHGLNMPEYKLSGTSAVGITEYDDNDEVIEKIERVAREYSESGKVILIAGNWGEVGEDIEEIVISNDTGGLIRRGAKFLCYIAE